MENAALIVLLESILGKGQSTSKGNYAFNCPLCTHHKPKLEINLKTNIICQNQDKERTTKKRPKQEQEEFKLNKESTKKK